MEWILLGLVKVAHKLWDLVVITSSLLCCKTLHGLHLLHQLLNACATHSSKHGSEGLLGSLMLWWPTDYIGIGSDGGLYLWVVKGNGGIVFVEKKNFFDSWDGIASQSLQSVLETLVIV